MSYLYMLGARQENLHSFNGMELVFRKITHLRIDCFHPDGNIRKIEVCLLISAIALNYIAAYLRCLLSNT